jgi:hypothetical protein
VRALKHYSNESDRDMRPARSSKERSQCLPQAADMPVILNRNIKSGLGAHIVYMPETSRRCTSTRGIYRHIVDIE